MQAAFLWYFKIFLCCKPLFQLHFCGSVKRHLLSNATQWLKILKNVSFSNSLNFSSLSQNELFWRVEFEYNETFWGDFRTQCAGFSNCLDILKYLRNCQKISLNVFISQPFMAKYFYSCLAMLLFDVFIRIAKWQWSKPSQQHPNRGGKTKYVIITMPKKKNEIHPTLLQKRRRKIFVPSWIFSKINENCLILQNCASQIFTPGMTQNYPL